MTDAADSVAISIKKRTDWKEVGELLDRLLLHTPLYTKLDFSDALLEQMYDLFASASVSLDCWCTLCKKQSTFTRKTGILDDPAYTLRAALSGQKLTKREQLRIALDDLGFRCSRDPSHRIRFVVQIVSRFNNGDWIPVLQKIGQMPSFGDLDIPALDKYKTVLSGEYLEEFKRAVGLASHGVGIGAFVYLRRIFERLINEAFKDATYLNDADREGFNALRKSEQIKLLASSLPTFLSENSHLYGILSKGVHELSEDECLKNFAAVRIAIELILDEHLEAKEREKKIADVRKAISAISSEMSGKAK